MISMYILGFTWFEMDSLCTLCTNMLNECVYGGIALGVEKNGICII